MPIYYLQINRLRLGNKHQKMPD